MSISISRKFTEQTRPSRAVFLKWPMGHPLGEPFNKVQQTIVLKKTLNALETIKEPATIIDLPFRWKRHEDLKL